MKTMTKKLGAIILALAMCFSLTCVAFAATGEGYNITIENATIGKTYTAYKIFDATYDEESGGVSYTISTSSALYESIAALTTVFNLSAATTDATTYYVTVVDGVSDAAVIAAIENLNIENLVTASASGEADKTTFLLDVGEPGYYYITSSLGTVVTIDTAHPTATVIDKNETVGENFAKYIVDENGEVIGKYGDAALGDELNFDITSDVPRYEGSDPVVEYVFTDTLKDSGLEIEIEVGTINPDGTIEHITITNDGRYLADESLINKFVTFTGSDGETTYTLNDVAYNYTLEFTDVTYDEESGYIVCGGFILTYYTYDSSTDDDGNTVYDLSSSKYPTDLTIDITYTTYVTDNANHFEANTATIQYFKYDPDEGIIPGDNSGITSTDYVYDWDLKIVKTDVTDSDKLLEGATFTLVGDNLNHVSVHTEYVYTLVTAGTELDPNTTYFYLLATGKYTTVAPTADTQDEYDPEYPGPYTRSVSSDTVIEDAGTMTITGTTDKDGVIIFDGLTEGTYTLTEVAAPDGYNLLSAPIVFVVTFDSETGIFNVSVTSGLSGNVTFDNDLEELALTIENSTGSELPSTGGIGTTIFYIIGGVLVAGAVVVLITRRRMNSAN